MSGIYHSIIPGGRESSSLHCSRKKALVTVLGVGV